MSDKTELMDAIIEGDLKILWNILSTAALEDQELLNVYKEVKYGIDLKYHIMWNLKNLIDIRDRQGTVLIQGQEYLLEDWWDEEEKRTSLARQTLLEYYSKEEAPYAGR